MGIQSERIKELVLKIQERDKTEEILRNAKSNIVHHFRQFLKWPLDIHNNEHVKSAKYFVKNLQEFYINGEIQKEEFEKIFKELPHFLTHYEDTAIAIVEAQNTLGTSNRARLALPQYVSQLLHEFEVLTRHTEGEKKEQLKIAENKLKEKTGHFFREKSKKPENFPLRKTLSGEIPMPQKSNKPEEKRADPVPAA